MFQKRFDLLYVSTSRNTDNKIYLRSENSYDNDTRRKERRKELEKLNQKRSKIVDDLYDLFNSSKENQQRVQESVNQSIKKGEAPDVFYRVEKNTGE